MVRRFPNLSGFVLVGGASRRMGQSKHLLQLGGETMLERQVRLLRGVCRSVAIIGSTKVSIGLDAPVFADEIAGRGPLGGIYTGLLYTRTEYNLFVGCDLPFLETRLLGHLARLALDSQADVTVPQDRRGRLEPLCAIYRRRALPVVRARLREGANKTSGFFPLVRCRVIPWREVAAAGITPYIFDNMNTPEDWQTAVRHFSAASSDTLLP